MLPSDSQARKARPVYTGVFAFFPDAIAEVAAVSKAGSEQHHPGEGVRWDRSKSTDEYDACARHLLDRAGGHEFDTDGQRHMAKVVWRGLAALQKEIERTQRTYEQTAYELFPDEYVGIAQGSSMDD